MQDRSVWSILIVALLAFGLGWVVAGVGEEESSLVGSGAGSGGDPAAALVEILRLDDPAERAVRLVRFFERTDPSTAIMLHDVLTTDEEGVFVDEIAEQLFAAWWARSDPEAAFTHIVDPTWGNRHPWVRSVFREWVHQDPIAAVEAVERLPEDPARGRLEAARVVIDEWFELEDPPDPARLLVLVERLEMRRRAFAIQRILGSLVERRGIDATLEFVESMGVSRPASMEYDLRQELLARMAVVLLNHDVERAVAWTAKYDDDRHGPGIRKHLAYYWGLKDGPAAMEWAMGLPDVPERPAVLQRAWLSFGRAEPDAAAEWLTSREPDPVLRHVYARFLRSLAANEPERALALAEGTPDPSIRQQMLMAVGQGWIRKDRAAAEAWLAEVDLPPEMVKRIRRTSRESPRRARREGGAG